MLVISVNPGKAANIGDVRIVNVGKTKMRIGIQAPPTIRIVREDAAEKTENKKAA